MGHHEHVVRAAEEDGAYVVHLVRIHAGKLLGQKMLANAVMVIEACLRTPADVEGAVHVRLGPFHDLAELFPVFYLFKGHELHGRTRDDHTVEVLVAHILEGLVEGEQVRARSVLGLMALGVHERQVHLKGRVAEKAGKLGLGHDLGGHEVEQEYAQGADVLREGARFCDNEDIFAV